MEITIHNYEQYILDYIENRLAKEPHAAMVFFLENNLDIAQTIDGLHKAVLKPESVDFEFKSSLKKTFPYGEKEFEALCVANIEGSISAEQKTTVEAILEQFTEQKKDWDTYPKTVLMPNRAVVFPDKEKLKKSPFVIWKNTVYAVMGMAAAVALFFSVINYNKTSTMLPIDTGYANKIAINDSIPVPNFHRNDSLFNKKVLENGKYELTINDSALAPSFPRRDSLNKTPYLSDKRNQLAMNDSALVPNFMKRDTIAVPYTKEQIAHINNGGSTAQNQQLVFIEDAQHINLGRNTETVLPATAKTYAQIDSYALVEDIKMDIAQFNMQEINRLKPSDFESYDQYLQAELRKRLFNVQPGERINYWALAEASVVGVNRVLGSELLVNHETDQAGKTKAFSLGNRLFFIERNK